MLLSLMVFVPLLGMIVVLLLPRESEELTKRVTLGFTLIPLANRSVLIYILRIGAFNWWKTVR